LVVGWPIQSAEAGSVVGVGRLANRRSPQSNPNPPVKVAQTGVS
jgi:hypothetical protein